MALLLEIVIFGLLERGVVLSLVRRIHIMFCRDKVASLFVDQLTWVIVYILLISFGLWAIWNVFY
jgi:hypothetical protein